MTWISIHAPREGSDVCHIYNQHHSLEFQSTLPARGATANETDNHKAIQFQSTLPARGATGRILQPRTQRMISIHAPREGSDVEKAINNLTRAIISIHAPREGSDFLLAPQRLLR